MSALEFGTMYFFRATSISRGLALFTAAKNLSTDDEVAAWDSCILEKINRAENRKTKTDLRLLVMELFIHDPISDISLSYRCGATGARTQDRRIMSP